MNLFSELELRSVKLRNRIAISPMCQYSSENGLPNEWHVVHLGQFALGGAALVFTEANAITPQGRISPEDLGIYSNEHVKAFKPITKFIKDHGAVPGTQLAHAGRKASTYRPWAPKHGEIKLKDGGWTTISSSPEAFSDTYPTPHELTISEIQGVLEDWKTAAKRAIESGFEILEIHAAHGYLLHQFYSPLSNHRTDKYGGSFENRIRLTCEVVAAVRSVVPQDFPLMVRISCTDWMEGGWTIEDSVKLARELKKLGVDLIDASSGGNIALAKIPVGPGYQVEFAQKIKHRADILTGAVGMITDPHQADTIIRTGQADLVLLAREMLRDPYWPSLAAKELGAPHDFVPKQYARAW